MFVSGEDYYRCVTGLLASSKTSDIAVAFIGEGAEDVLSRMKAGRIICNLESGATNPAVISILLDNPSMDVRSLATLHAKVFISDRSVLSGSANLSANGLGLEGIEIARWEEAGILAEDASAVESARQWFAMLWNASIAIGPEELARAEAMWQRRRHFRPPALSPYQGGLFARLMEDWTFCKDRPLYLVAYRKGMTLKARNAFAYWKKAQGMSGDSTIECYENWSELPVNAFLLDFYLGPKGGLKPYGLYWTGPEEIKEDFNYRGGDQGEIRVVFKQNAYEGLRVKHDELKWFSDLIRSYLSRLLNTASVDGDEKMCIPLDAAFKEMSNYGLQPTRMPRGRIHT